MRALRVDVSWSVRAATLTVFLGLALLFIWGSVQDVARASQPPRCDWSGQEYDDFYAPPDLGEVGPERLGEVLRVEHLQSYTPEEVIDQVGETSEYGAEVYRILYLSQAPVGQFRAVSGLLVVPTGPVPDGGFPVIAHGHGTTGLADSCAPSRPPRQRRSVPDLLSWGARGFVVTATDYVGLGTPGLHPYTVGAIEAFSMLDAARAALRFCDANRGIDSSVAANRIFLAGHSQGGHAALFAHQYWGSYAPELNLMGTVAFAPGAEPRLLVQEMADAEVRSLLVGPSVMAMYAYSEWYGAPAELDAWLKGPIAAELPERAERQCSAGLGLWLGLRADDVFEPALLEAVREDRWEDLQPWTDYMDANTPGNFTSEVPVLVLQGEFDALIPPMSSERVTARLCVNGTASKLSLYPFVGHTRIFRTAQPEALQWMAERLAGEPISDTCGAVVFRAYAPVVSR